MFSVPDILVVSVLALLLFGPDRLPKLMRQAGRFMREVQNTSHGFISEMERAADFADQPVPPKPASYEPPVERTEEEHVPDVEPVPDDHSFDGIPEEEHVASEHVENVDSEQPVPDERPPATPDGATPV
jgi:TatA/E family protein of Tat protein translocase